MKVNKDLKVEGKRVVYLYLADWQIRMVKDFLGVDCDGMEIPVENPPIVSLYAVGLFHKEHKRMYLTDWQMRELKDEIGFSCDFIELSKDVNVFRYGVPTM